METAEKERRANKKKISEENFPFVCAEKNHLVILEREKREKKMMNMMKERRKHEESILRDDSIL